MCFSSGSRTRYHGVRYMSEVRKPTQKYFGLVALVQYTQHRAFGLFVHRLPYSWRTGEYYPVAVLRR